MDRYSSTAIYFNQKGRGMDRAYKQGLAPIHERPRSTFAMKGSALYKEGIGIGGTTRRRIDAVVKVSWSIDSISRITDIPDDLADFYGIAYVDVSELLKVSVVMVVSSRS
jgi:hypothetical protein